MQEPYRVVDVEKAIDPKGADDWESRGTRKKLRHVSDLARERLDTLQEGEELRVSIEPANPNGTPAVQLQTTDYQMIGWAPRYLAPDLATTGGKYDARVVRVNPTVHGAPLRQRILIEMRCYWENHEPMSGRDYTPLIDQGFEDGVGPAPKLVLSD